MAVAATGCVGPFQARRDGAGRPAAQTTPNVNNGKKHTLAQDKGKGKKSPAAPSATPGADRPLARPAGS